MLVAVLGEGPQRGLQDVIVLALPGPTAGLAVGVHRRHHTRTLPRNLIFLTYGEKIGRRWRHVALPSPCTPTMSVHYPASDAAYALVVVPGPGTDRVALGLFCAHRAARG